MPTIATTRWPRPKSEDEWEDMVLDWARIRWSDPNAQRNGRRGQKQNGVDIVAHSGGVTFGVQAKHMDHLAKGLAFSEIQKAENFTPALHELHFAISGPRDAAFQEVIRNESALRVARGAFAVHVVYFDDVCHEFSSYPKLIRKYWGPLIDAVRSFGDSVPAALSTPVLDIQHAIDLIQGLPEFGVLAEQIEAHSACPAEVFIRVEGTPKLDSPAGSLGRAWHLAIAEDHDTHTVTRWRVAIDVDSGHVRYYSVMNDRWLTKDEWLSSEQW